MRRQTVRRPPLARTSSLAVSRPAGAVRLAPCAFAFLVEAKQVRPTGNKGLACRINNRAHGGKQKRKENALATPKRKKK